MWAYVKDDTSAILANRANIDWNTNLRFSKSFELSGVGLHGIHNTNKSVSVRLYWEAWDTRQTCSICACGRGQYCKFLVRSQSQLFFILRTVWWSWDCCGSPFADNESDVHNRHTYNDSCAQRLSHTLSLLIDFLLVFSAAKHFLINYSWRHRRRPKKQTAVDDAHCRTLQ